MNAFYRYIGHRRHYGPKELRRVLEESGFRVESAYGAGFPFFNLFRILLTIGGQKLTREVTGPPSLVVRLGMRLFDFLFRFNSTRLGWQTVAVARRV